jgi:hypothetical protein
MIPKTHNEFAIDKRSDRSEKLKNLWKNGES